MAEIGLRQPPAKRLSRDERDRGFESHPLRNFEMKRYLTIFLIFIFLPDYSFSQIIGHFGRVEGDVKIKRRGASEAGKIFEGFTIGEGDWIATGNDGKVEMIFNGGYILKMKENSSIKIFHAVSTPKGEILSRVIMDEGLFFVKIEPRRGLGMVPEIEIPHGLVFGKRGSIFVIKISKDETQVYSLEGKVVVKDKKEEVSVPLYDGYMTSISKSGVQSPPQQIDPDEKERLRRIF